MKRLYPVVFVVILGLSLSSCFGPTTLNSLKKTDPVAKQRSYLYGNFYMKKAGVRMSLTIKNLNNNKIFSIDFDYSGLFSKLQKEKIVSLDPGKYVIDQIRVTTNAGQNSKTTAYDFRYSEYRRPFVLEPGKKYYLGDFVGTGITMQSKSFIRARWNYIVVNRYEETTREINDNYTNIKEIESQDLFPDLKDLLVKKYLKKKK